MCRKQTEVEASIRQNIRVHRTANSAECVNIRPNTCESAVSSDEIPSNQPRKGPARRHVKVWRGHVIVMILKEKDTTGCNTL